MDASASIAKKYIAALKGDKIDSVSLTKLPELVTCNDWNKVEIVGSIDHISERTKAHYKGILVTYGGGLYYMKNGVVMALANHDKRFGKVKNIIRVVAPPPPPAGAPKDIEE